MAERPSAGGTVLQWPEQNQPRTAVFAPPLDREGMIHTIVVDLIVPALLARLLAERDSSTAAA